MYRKTKAKIRNKREWGTQAHGHKQRAKWTTRGKIKQHIDVATEKSWKKKNANESEQKSETRKKQSEHKTKKKIIRDRQTR